MRGAIMYDKSKCLTLNRSGEMQIKNNLPPNSAVEDIAGFYSVFSDSTRLKILSALAITELCVGDICGLLDFNQTTVSHQLKLLRDAKIVGCRRKGKIVVYKITNPYVNEVMNTGVNHLSLTNVAYR